MPASRCHQSYDIIITGHQCTTSRDTNEDMAVAFSPEEQRIYIESYRKKTAGEIHIALQEACGNNSRLAYQFNSCQIECKS